MVSYEVAWRRVGTRRWTKLEGVKGDGFVVEEHKLGEGRGIASIFETRFFVQVDETRTEVSTRGLEFRFGKERFLRITELMSQEAGQQIVTNPK